MAALVKANESGKNFANFLFFFHHIANQLVKPIKGCNESELQFEVHQTFYA